PTFPKIKPLFMMGLGGAFLLALLVVFSAEVLSATAPGAQVQTMMRREPVFEAPTAPVAPQPVAAPRPTVQAAASAQPAPPAEGPLPAFGPVLEELNSVTSGGLSLTDAGAICVNDPLSDFSLAIRRVYQVLKDEARTTGNKRFVWTSGEDLDDRAAVLANLARTFAQNGAKIIAVDADPDSDEMAEVFMAGEGLGLSDLLTGRAAFTDAVTRDPMSSLQILRQGGQAAPAQSLFGGKRMDYVLDALDQAYDFVLVNAAPMTERSAHAIAAKAGSALVCAADTRSGKRAGAEAIRTLKALHVPKVAAVTVHSDNVFSRLLAKYRRAA
ncbi:MAG: hypothetical protein ACR2PM_13985, partial [Hyphomicrobiales bacterium]